MDPVQDFLTNLLRSLVDVPDEVNVERKVDEMGVLLMVDVSPEDMGKVIGRRGATAKAIRTLLRVVGMKFQQRVNMKINEPEGGIHSMENDGGNDAPAPEAASPDEVDAVIADLKDEME